MNIPFLNHGCDTLFYANTIKVPTVFNGIDVSRFEYPCNSVDCSASNFSNTVQDLIVPSTVTSGGSAGFDLPANSNTDIISFNNTFSGLPPDLCANVDAVAVQFEVSINPSDYFSGVNITVEIQAGTFQSAQAFYFSSPGQTTVEFIIPAIYLQQFSSGLNYSLFVYPRSFDTIWDYDSGGTFFTLSGSEPMIENGFAMFPCSEEPCTIKAYGENGLLYETAPFACPEYDCEDCFREITWGDCEDNQFQLFVKDLSFGLDEVQTEVEEYITSTGVLTSAFTSIRKQYTLTIPYCCYAEFWGDLAGKTITVNNQDYLLSGLVVNEDNIDLTLVSYKEDDCCC